VTPSRSIRDSKEPKKKGGRVRIRGADGLIGVRECLDQQVGPRRVADPADCEGHLAAHHGVGMMQRLPEQRRVEHAGVGDREQAGELAHQRLILLLRRAAPPRRSDRQHEQQAGATRGPDPAPA